MAGSRKVIFLDRDGTINVDHGYVGEIARWEFTPRAPEALRLLQAMGFSLVVVSNQAGIADGRFDDIAVKALHDHMTRELARHGVTLDAVAYCPHGRDASCACRKPKTGMARAIEKSVGAIDYAASWTIGDKPSDVQFGKNLGTRTALIRSRYWVPEDSSTQSTQVVDSLYAFARSLTSAA